MSSVATCVQNRTIQKATNKQRLAYTETQLQTMTQARTTKLYKAAPHCSQLLRHEVQMVRGQHSMQENTNTRARLDYTNMIADQLYEVMQEFSQQSVEANSAIAGGHNPYRLVAAQTRDDFIRLLNTKFSNQSLFSGTEAGDAIDPSTRQYLGNSQHAAISTDYLSSIDPLITADEECFRLFLEATTLATAIGSPPNPDDMVVVQNKIDEAISKFANGPQFRITNAIKRLQQHQDRVDERMLTARDDYDMLNGVDLVEQGYKAHMESNQLLALNQSSLMVFQQQRNFTDMIRAAIR